MAQINNLGLWLPSFSLHLQSVSLFCWSYFQNIPRIRVCVCVCVCVYVLVTQSCLTFCNPMDCSPLGSSVHGILQARILEWVDFSKGSSWSRDWTWVSCIAGVRFTVWTRIQVLLTSSTDILIQAIANFHHYLFNSLLTHLPCSSVFSQYSSHSNILKM